ncbi:MAG: hypothetical protein PHO66_03965 [Eubacteriales bacterium]|nr:hypothetical protein [Eubacteriales bacterium]
MRSENQPGGPILLSNPIIKTCVDYGTAFCYGGRYKTDRTNGGTMGNIYYLGGSPCCGKSTIAEKLSEKYKLQYYKADNSLEKFILQGAMDAEDWLKHISAMTMDELWLRDPQTLKEEEWITYEKLFPYFINELNHLDNGRGIIAEGAAFLPCLINRLGVDKTHYVCVVPTEEFQIQQYSKRMWVKDYLSSCSDKDKAFKNWMKRDALFALAALAQAKEFGYATLVVDGSKNVDENVSFIESSFQLI